MLSPSLSTSSYPAPRRSRRLSLPLSRRATIRVALPGGSAHHRAVYDARRAPAMPGTVRSMDGGAGRSHERESSMPYSSTIRGERFVFADLREVFARANEEKSGDRLAGIAAHTERERVAAKLALADVILGEI